jgi:hypothetical protein
MRIAGELAARIARQATAAAGGDPAGLDRLARACVTLTGMYPALAARPVAVTTDTAAAALLRHVQAAEGFLPCTAGAVRASIAAAVVLDAGDVPRALAARGLAVLPDPLPVDDSAPVLAYSTTAYAAVLLSAARRAAAGVDGAAEHLARLVDEIPRSLRPTREGHPR